MARRRRRTMELLRALELEKTFSTLPASSRKYVLDRIYPSPRVEFDSSCSQIEDNSAIAEDVLAVMRLIREKLARTECEVSATEVFTILAKTIWCLRALCHRDDCQVAAKSLLDVLEPIFFDTLKSVHVPWAVDYALILHSRFDVHVLHHDSALEEINEGRVQMHLTVSDTAAKERRLQVDHQARRAFHCFGITTSCEEIEAGNYIHWVEWSPAKMSFGLHEAPVPVFVQSHAIDQMLDRVGDTNIIGWFFHSMYRSLRYPEIVKGSNGEFLVAHELQGIRIGYFVVTYHESFFLVRTFLFLTMKGTPEAAALYSRLRTSRHGIETMHLDRLTTFLDPELRSDEAICRVLRESRCGQLLELADKTRLAPADFSAAMHIRRYLGWRQATHLESNPSPPVSE